MGITRSEWARIFLWLVVTSSVGATESRAVVDAVYWYGRKGWTIAHLRDLSFSKVEAREVLDDVFEATCKQICTVLGQSTREELV